MSERQFFDDHNLIHVYTRAQAIALVDFGNIKLEPDKTEFSVSVEGNSIILTIITADGKETDTSSESCPMHTEGEA